MKEALTDYNGIGSIKYIIDDNLKNEESTSKQIKKKMKKNKPILMVEERHLPKQSTKNKIKSFLKKIIQSDYLKENLMLQKKLLNIKSKKNKWPQT